MSQHELSPTPAAQTLADAQLDFFMRQSGSRPSDVDRRAWRRLLAHLNQAVWAGHTCMPLDDTWASVLAQWPQVWDETGNRPLVYWQGCLYLARLWHYERLLWAGVAKRLEKRTGASASSAPPAWLETTALSSEQKKAVETALREPVTLVTGGPGTGKTTALLYILRALLERYPDARIALAAPTGKAAARMSEAIRDGLNRQADWPADVAERLSSLAALTLHRLLGARPDRPQARYGEEAPLPADIVVVDEASMVDLPMMSWLAQALRADGRLILLGDADQLASVEMGAVLQDLCAALPEQTVRLRKSHRSNQAILRLARAVNRGDRDAVFSVLQEDGGETLLRLPPTPQALIQAVVEAYEPYWDALKRSENDSRSDAETARAGFAALARFRALCAHRHGPAGMIWLNEQLSRLWPHRHGRVVVVTENMPMLQLANGDTGIVLEREGRGMAWFQQADGGVRPLPSSMLPRHETAFAMTVHQSQGSEFDHAMLVLPLAPSPVLSRALIYTAITRARTQFTLWGSDAVLQAAVSATLKRRTGLQSWARLQPPAGGGAG